MDDLFSKRMSNALKNGSLGAKLVNDANTIEDKLFTTDTNYREGYIYDWDMNPIEKIGFKFEKVKTFTAEGYQVEYHVHFQPNYNPEQLYKDRYYVNDNRERLGFYIDVLDYSKNIVEKWLIVGKDDRVTFDRYNAFKCNWCFEWMYNGDYHSCVGCIRDAMGTSYSDLQDDNLGGSSVIGDMAIILPSNKTTSTIVLGTRLMISDNVVTPYTYEVINVKSVSPLGVLKVYLKRCLINRHVDFWGIVNEASGYEFLFNTPLEDLPDEYGKQYHMICDCIASKGLPSLDEPSESAVYKIDCDANKLYVNGQTVVVGVNSSNGTYDNCYWHVFIDGVEYGVGDLSGYFDIQMQKESLHIKAINKVMAKYIVTIVITDDIGTRYDFVDLEVTI